MTSDRPSAVLLIRREEDGIRIGIPEPSHQSIHSGDEWWLSAGDHCEPLDLPQIYRLAYVDVRPKAHDVTKKGFFWPRMRCRP